MTGMLSPVMADNGFAAAQERSDRQKEQREGNGSLEFTYNPCAETRLAIRFVRPRRIGRCAWCQHARWVQLSGGSDSSDQAA